MRHLFLMLIVITSAACEKKPRPVIEPYDAQKAFRLIYSDHIQLLALKHDIPRGKAETIAWVYYQRHDLGFAIMPTPDGQHRKSLEQCQVGVSDTVIELADKYGVSDRAVAAFLVDFKLLNQSNQP